MRQQRGFVFPVWTKFWRQTLVEHFYDHATGHKEIKNVMKIKAQKFESSSGNISFQCRSDSS